METEKTQKYWDMWWNTSLYRRMCAKSVISSHIQKQLNWDWDYSMGPAFSSWIVHYFVLVTGFRYGLVNRILFYLIAVDISKRSHLNISLSEQIIFWILFNFFICNFGRFPVSRKHRDFINKLDALLVCHLLEALKYGDSQHNWCFQQKKKTKRKNSFSLHIPFSVGRWTQTITNDLITLIRSFAHYVIKSLFNQAMIWKTIINIVST